VQRIVEENGIEKMTGQTVSHYRILEKIGSGGRVRVPEAYRHYHDR